MWLIYNVILIPVVQQSDQLCMYVHSCSYSLTLWFISGYEYIDSSLCCALGPCCLSFYITVIRDGNKITLDNVVFPQISSDGIVFGSIDFLVYGEDRTFSTIIKNSYYSSKSTIKMIWDSLYDLITGRYGMEQVSGPIGVTGAITNAAKTSTYSLFYLVVVISMNLGIFNLLPIPALDGGSLLLIIIEMIIRRPIPQKIDYGIKAIGFLLLMGFAILVTFKDIIFLFR